MYFVSRSSSHSSCPFCVSTVIPRSFLLHPLMHPSYRNLQTGPVGPPSTTVEDRWKTKRYACPVIDTLKIRVVLYTIPSCSFHASGCIDKSGVVLYNDNNHHPPCNVRVPGVIPRVHTHIERNSSLCHWQHHDEAGTSGVLALEEFWCFRKRRRTRRKRPL